jgi:hypothetical protein
MTSWQFPSKCVALILGGANRCLWPVLQNCWVYFPKRTILIASSINSCASLGVDASVDGIARGGSVAASGDVSSGAGGKFAIRAVTWLSCARKIIVVVV